MAQYSVTVAATSRMLCKRSDVRSRLGIEDPSENAKIDALILASSSQIRRMLGREPWLQTYVEKIPGQGGASLLLPHWPALGDPSSVTYGTGSSPSTVTASTYSVGGTGRRDRLFRSSLWADTDIIAGAPVYGSQLPEYTVTYTAGWVMPNVIDTWTKSTSYAASVWVAPTLKSKPYIALSGGSGTSDTTEPDWPTAAEGTVIDNDITWTAYDQRLPHDLEEAALMLTLELYQGFAPAGIKRETFEGRTVEYFSEHPALTSAVSSLVEPYK